MEKTQQLKIHLENTKKNFEGKENSGDIAYE
jgi:hypothetical protein